MLIIRAPAVRYLFRFHYGTFSKYIKKIDGAIFYREKWWFDAILLKSKIPLPALKFLIKNYSVSFSEVGVLSLPLITIPKRITLAMLMLTIKEASVLTRIPEDAFNRAMLLGELKPISLGVSSFISRHELERLLGIILNEEKVREVVTSTLIRTRKTLVTASKWREFK